MIDRLEDLAYHPTTWFVVAVVFLLMAVFFAGVAVICATTYPEGTVFAGLFAIISLGLTHRAAVRARSLWRLDREIK